MTHAVIIRMHYPPGDPRFAWRLAYFYSMVLPRLLAQTDQNFDIWIRCRAEDVAVIQSLHPRLHTFQVKNEAEQSVQKYGRRYFQDFVPWADVVGLPQYDIQTGLDSDDLVRKDFIERISYEVGQWKDSTLGKGHALHISFQPQLFDLKTLQQYSMSQRYNPKKGSAFMALYQPNFGPGYRFIYEDSHLRLWRFAAHSITLPVGYCWASCHDLNESTKVGKQIESDGYGLN